MADAALEYVQSLIKSGKSPAEIKTQLLSKGWESAVIDLYLSKAKSDTIAPPKSVAKPLIFILLLLILVVAGAGGYYFWKLKVAPKPSSPSPVSTAPEFTASPSASLAPNLDSVNQLKAGFGLLFSPPEYGYEATVSAQISDCQAKIFYDSRQNIDSRYDLVDARAPATSCPSLGFPTRFEETYRFSDRNLTRSSQSAKLALTSSPPANSDADIKSFLGPLDKHTLLESIEVPDGLQIKTRLLSDDLEGTYQFTIRPVSHRVSHLLFSAAKKTSSGVVNLTGDFIFMSRAHIPTPMPQQIQ